MNNAVETLEKATIHSTILKYSFNQQTCTRCMRGTKT